MTKLFALIPSSEKSAKRFLDVMINSSVKRLKMVLYARELIMIMMSFPEITLRRLIQEVTVGQKILIQEEEVLKSIMKMNMIIVTSTVMIMIETIVHAETMDTTNTVLMINTTHLSAGTMTLSLVLMNMRRSKILMIDQAVAAIAALRTQDTVDACQPKELSLT